MRHRKRLTRTYRDIEVPIWVLLTTLWFWLVVGVAVALHFNSFDIPTDEANVAGFVSGGFIAAFFYLLMACE